MRVVDYKRLILLPQSTCLLGDTAMRETWLTRMTVMRWTSSSMKPRLCECGLAQHTPTETPSMLHDLSLRVGEAEDEQDIRSRKGAG